MKKDYTYADDFKYWLEEIIMKNNMKPAKFAKALDIDPERLRLVLKGVNRPSFEILIRLGAYLNYDANKFTKIILKKANKSLQHVSEQVEFDILCLFDWMDRYIYTEYERDKCVKIMWNIICNNSELEKKLKNK